MAFDPKECVDFMRMVSDAETTNRADGLSDLRFSYGEQWSARDIASRTLESRPCLTINKTDSFIRQVTNSQRQQRPRIKVHPMDSIADPKIAEVMTGLIRHIEVNSDADQAYDTAFNFAARIGWGYWRVVTDYVREDSFDQDIYIQQIENPFTVYFDPNSSLPDGSDAEKCLITDLLTKANFKKLYPHADMTEFQAMALGDNASDWVTEHDIRIAEYFSTDKVRDKLVMLSDKTVVYASQLPSNEVLQGAGISVVGDRDSFRKQIMWRKVAGGQQLLEEKIWPGRWIPVIPVYGDQIIVDGKRKRFGLVRFARDPQMMYNFWRTAMTETIAMAPKAKWLIVEGQDEGFENDWNRSNTAATAVLRYKQTDVNDQKAPEPQRIQPEPPPSGMMEAAGAVSDDLQSVLGIFDPAMGKPSGPKSGTAIRAEQGQSEQSNFHLYDNLTRSIKHEGRIILDLFPKVYDTQRVMRIIGDDGQPDLVTVNEQQTAEAAQQQQGQMPDPDAQAIQSILNDVTVGTYDISMEVGPGFASKRQEGVAAMTAIVQADPDIMKVAGDLLIRNMDFPGADVIADRMAAANPLADIDEKSDVPPRAQMMIKQLQSQLQQAGQQIQAQDQVIKSRSDLETMKQESETKRALMTHTIKAHESEVWAKEERDQFESVERTKRHDTATRAITAQNVAEINGVVQLLINHLDTARLQQQAQQADEQTASVADS